MAPEPLQRVRGVEPFPVGPIEDLSPTHHALAVAVREGRAAEPGSPAREFLGLVRAANLTAEPPLSIRDLPLEVVQVILDSRQKTMTEFFRAWSDSIAKNAAADRQASVRSERDQSEAKRADLNRRSASLFASAMNRAQNTGRLTAADVEAFSRTAGLSRPEAQAQPPLKSVTAGVNNWSPTLELPKR